MSECRATSRPGLYALVITIWLHVIINSLTGASNSNLNRKLDQLTTMQPCATVRGESK
jgi:hypothetical protein